MTGRSINEARIDRAVLLVRLRGNRDKHVLDFNEALIGWQQQVTEAINQLHNKWDTSKELDMAGVVRLTKPVSYVKDYDRVIEMLENGLDDEIILSSEEFTQFWLDEWQWSHQFKHSTSNYVANRR